MKDLEAAWGNPIVPQGRTAGITVHVDELSIVGFLDGMWRLVGTAAAKSLGMRLGDVNRDPGMYFAELGDSGLTLTMGLMSMSGKFFVEVQDQAGDSVADAEFPFAMVADKNYKFLAQKVAGVIRKALGHPQEPGVE